MSESTQKLSQAEIERYLRHFNLDEVGYAGQLKLKNSKVLCVGAGGLGSPALLYLAAAGVGKIGLVDDDVVDLSNLQRQVLFSTNEVGVLKVEAAKKKLELLNPHSEFVAHAVRLSSENALDILKDYDLVIDGTDNFSAKYLISDACRILKKTLVYSSIFQFQGQCTVFYPGGPCYRCVFPSPPPAELAPNCAEGGVLGVLPGIMGCIQANEAMKCLLEIGTPLKDRMLTFDALAMSFRSLNYKKSKTCLCNSDSKTLGSEPDACASELEDDEGDAPVVKTIEVSELKKMIDENRDAFLLIDVREVYEFDYSNIGGFNLPLSELEDEASAHLASLKNSEKPLVVLCKAGGRSLEAAGIFQAQGFQNVLNVKGGLKAWARAVDSKFKVL